VGKVGKKGDKIDPVWLLLKSTRSGYCYFFLFSVEKLNIYDKFLLKLINFFFYLELLK
jgi:hypothetical protein